MTSRLMPDVIQQILDDNGDPLSGGKIYAYEAGTTTPKDTYTDSTLGTPNANPVILDADGRANIWLGTGEYKFRIDDSADNTIKTVDNVPGAVPQVLAGDIESKSTNFTTDADDKFKHFDCTSSLTISLQAAATAGEGFVFSVRNSSSGSVTLDPNGSENINGATTLVLNPRESAFVLCTGTEWFALFIQQPSLHLDKAANYTPVLGDQGKVILIDASGGDITISLPPVASTVDGFELRFKKIDSSVNTVTIDGNAVETIDGEETYVLYKQYESLWIKGDTAAWHNVNRAIVEPSVFKAKTANYTVTTQDNRDIIPADCTSGDLTITLPAVADVPAGFQVTIKRTDNSANDVIIDGNASETIDGDATQTLFYQYDALTLMTDGTEWHIIKSNLFAGLLDVQVFTSSGTWTKPKGCNRALVEVLGGGAGGAGNQTSTNGSAGGTSSFGSHLSATGGSGGQISTSSSGAGGASGVGSNGDVNARNENGRGGWQSDYSGALDGFGGDGGSSIYGNGGQGGRRVQAAGDATGYGAGGGGAGDPSNPNNGGGGGAGGYAKKMITSGLGDTETVTVGTGGSGGAAGGGDGTAGLVVVYSYRDIHK